MEVPAGAIADKFGRKISVSLSLFLIGFDMIFSKLLYVFAR